MLISSLNLISRWGGESNQGLGGEESPENPEYGCALGGELRPPALPQVGYRFIVFLHTGRAAFWTITHLSAINGPPECGVLSPNPWVMIIGGKCLWGNSYRELGVLERIYLLKISQQQFSLQLSSLSLCFLNIHETCRGFRLKISTRWVVRGILHLRWYWICF